MKTSAQRHMSKSGIWPCRYRSPDCRKTEWPILHMNQCQCHHLGYVRSCLCRTRADGGTRSPRGRVKHPARRGAPYDTVIPQYPQPSNPLP
jgi:hypothetical protein